MSKEVAKINVTALASLKAERLKAIEDGTLLGSVLNDSYNQGKATFYLAYELARGIQPTGKSIGYSITNGKYVWIPYVKVTKNNYMSFYDKSMTL